MWIKYDAVCGKQRSGSPVSHANQSGRAKLTQKKKRQKFEEKWNFCWCWLLLLPATVCTCVRLYLAAKAREITSIAQTKRPKCSRFQWVDMRCQIFFFPCHVYVRVSVQICVRMMLQYMCFICTHTYTHVHTRACTRAEARAKWKRKKVIPPRKPSKPTPKRRTLSFQRNRNYSQFIRNEEISLHLYFSQWCARIEWFGAFVA